VSLRYVTTNEGKLEEAAEYLGTVEQLDYDYTEIQAGDLASIATYGAREAFRVAGEPVMVDDAGLFLEGFDGFPGPYSAYVEDTLGVERVGELARDAGATRAQFRCVLAYCDGDSFAATPEPVDRGDRRGQDLAAAERDRAATDQTVQDGELPVKLFTGAVVGTIVKPRGDGGFGYDPIFEHRGTTLAEMDAAEKNAISHRGRALATFAEWFADREVDPRN
jgi:XTP/dITP diphosphohydrolase